MNPLINAMRMMGGNPFGNIQQVMAQANQIAQMVRNHQTLMQQFFPDVPADQQSNPDQVIDYLVKSGRITRQQIDQIRQMLPR